ncbi:MAG TPA: lytic transglycosylase domain-containing protein [Thermoanaerobaculia bacterium]|nr:lytic transglycosylase domain-containing protein [Thermoanaerobaculia bacterium]
MKTKIVIAVTLLAATLARADERKFSAVDLPNVHIKRGTVITIAGNPLNATPYRAMPRYLASLIDEASRTHGVDPRLVAAVAGRESAFNADAVSRVGACGIMQLMPETARYLGVSDVFDARQNVFAGARYLRTLLDTFKGDLDRTLAAYNAGPGAVAKYNGVPPYRETKAYVAAVRATYERSLR